jgi:hypothetical protein
MMMRSQMQSLVDAVRDSVTGSTQLNEAKVYKGLGAFSDDESMLDDLEYDLQTIGLKPTKDYVLDIKKGTLTVKKSNSKLKGVLRQYRLKEEVEEGKLPPALQKAIDAKKKKGGDDEEETEEATKDLNKSNVDKALTHD